MIPFFLFIQSLMTILRFCKTIHSIISKIFNWNLKRLAIYFEYLPFFIICREKIETWAGCLWWISRGRSTAANTAECILVFVKTSSPRFYLFFFGRSIRWKFYLFILVWWWNSHLGIFVFVSSCSSSFLFGISVMLCWFRDSPLPHPHPTLVFGGFLFPLLWD